MKYVLFCLPITFFLFSCGGPPTPSASEIRYATQVAETEARELSALCQSDIFDKVSLLDKAADACSGDYKCRAMIEQQINDLASELSTCGPYVSSCTVRIIRAHASVVGGAPNETGYTRIQAEETLMQQYIDAIEICTPIY